VKREAWSETMAIQSYRELEVWQLSMDLAVDCYKLTRSLPREEVFGMSSQIRRAASSIPVNIAEGQGRSHTKEFLNHLSIARGSLLELETFLQLAFKIGFIGEEIAQQSLATCERVSQMLTRLRQALERKLT